MKAAIELSLDIRMQLQELCSSEVASVYRKARIVLLSADAVSAHEIARALGISVRSVTALVTAFKTDGIDALIESGSCGREAAIPF